MREKEPPEPVKTRIYRCDQTFLTDILRGMLEEKGQYALIVMDRREATLGILEGKNIRVVKHLNYGVPGKNKAGGQSSQRFDHTLEYLHLAYLLIQ